MHDLLFADQGRLEDPHLWARARTLGLDLERFDADRRSDAVTARIKRDFESGVRGGVVTTPTLIADGRRYAGQVGDELPAALSRRRRLTASPAGANPGSWRANVDPCSVLVTVQRPPWRLAIASTIASPSPTPPAERVRAASARANRSKMRPSASS